MRSYIPGGQLQVRKNITHDYKNLWLTPDQYSDTEIERMDSYSMGQGWTIRFTQKHQCHGAMLMLIHAITPNQRWDEQLDDEVTYAVTPYVESDRGNGGFSARSFLQADSELSYLLKVMDERLGDLTLKCDAARLLFRESLYQHLNTEDAACINTTKVSPYYSVNEEDLYS